MRKQKQLLLDCVLLFSEEGEGGCDLKEHGPPQHSRRRRHHGVTPLPAMQMRAGHRAVQQPNVVVDSAAVSHIARLPPTQEVSKLVLPGPQVSTAFLPPQKCRPFSLSPPRVPTGRFPVATASNSRRRRFNDCHRRGVAQVRSSRCPRSPTPDVSSPPCRSLPPPRPAPDAPSLRQVSALFLALTQ